MWKVLVGHLSHIIYYLDEVRIVLPLSALLTLARIPSTSWVAGRSRGWML